MKQPVVIESQGIQIHLAPDETEVIDLVVMRVARPCLRTSSATTAWIDRDVLRAIVENAEQVKEWLQ